MMMMMMINVMKIISCNNLIKVMMIISFKGT